MCRALLDGVKPNPDTGDHSVPHRFAQKSHFDFDYFFWPRKVLLDDEPIDKFVEVKFCNGQYWPSTMVGASSMTN